MDPAILFISQRYSISGSVHQIHLFVPSLAMHCSTSIGLLIRAGLHFVSDSYPQAVYICVEELTLPQEPQVFDPSAMDALHLGQLVCISTLLSSDVVVKIFRSMTGTAVGN